MIGVVRHAVVQRQRSGSKRFPSAAVPREVTENVD